MSSINKKTSIIIPPWIGIGAMILGYSFEITPFEIIFDLVYGALFTLIFLVFLTVSFLDFTASEKTNKTIEKMVDLNILENYWFIIAIGAYLGYYGAWYLSIISIVSVGSILTIKQKITNLLII